MNLLTQSLLKELLGEQKTVAIYGGGFKPPTKGHFHVAELTLEKFPEIDELKIFVGGGVRDGITQDESIKIWNIYKNYLSPKVDVEASVAPVKSILGYAKENPDTKVYWILGARDGDEGDLADIKNRTKSISKYPNLEVKVITTSGGVSGTKTRQAIRDNNKEQFFHMIPDVNNTEKEEIWNMVSPIIKEGIVDNIKTKIKDFISAVKQEGQETKEIVGLLIHATQGKIKLTDEQKEYIGNQLKDVLKLIGLTAVAVLPGGSIAAVLLKVFKQTHLITPSSMMNEIGDASAKVYPFTSDIDPSKLVDIAKKFHETNTSTVYFDTKLVYKFKTDKANYDVRFHVVMERKSYANIARNPNWKPGPPYKTYASVGFNIEGDTEEKISNLNEQFSVLSTVTKIIFDFIDNVNASGGNLVSLQVAPKSDIDTGSKLDSKRGKFYAAYIKKNLSKLPDYDAKEGKNDQGDEYVEIYKKNSINEVGEANLKPYKWKEVDAEGYWVYTRFVTDSETEYDVDLKSTNYIDDNLRKLRTIEIEFSAKPKGAEGGSAKIVVNKGELYRVMATVADIVKKYIKKSKAQAIIYSPSKKSNEENFGVQRDNLYKAFISKAFPGTKFEKIGNLILATLPDTINELVTDTEVICDNCGWEWKIEDGGDDLYTCHKCGHDNTPNLGEGKQVGLLYHYTSTNGLKGILQSNRINASEENYLGNELYYISFTRNKNFYKKGSKFGVSTEYRITLDGDKLSNKYKIRPFAYRPGWEVENSWELDWLDDEPESVRRDFFNATGDYDEQEERIFFKNKNGGMDNIKNYILAVDKIEDLDEGRKKKPEPEKGTGKKPEGSSRRLYTDEDPKDTVKIKFKTKEDIVDTLNKESFKSKPHARKSQIINVIHQRVRAAYSKAKDPEVKSRLKRALDYIEKRKEMSKKKTERLRKMKEASDPQAGTALPYGSGFAPVKENDLFGLNELAKDFVKEVFDKAWNLQEGMLSLSKYMIDNGMNIKPLPKIKVIDNDAENASNLLGKTAYYNPVEKSITLFTMNRHPKDVLRSFAHEMIHHEQNLNGKLNNITTQNTNEDGDLPKIEKEAYEKGNMMLRNWEDSIKNV